MLVGAVGGVLDALAVATAGCALGNQWLFPSRITNSGGKLLVCSQTRAAGLDCQGEGQSNVGVEVCT
jgi:hypothetical protein